MSNSSRYELLTLHVSPDQKALLEQVAASRSLSVSQYILDVACREAEADVACRQAEAELAEQTSFRLNDEQWAAFTALLDRAPVDKPGLRALFEGPTLIDGR